MTTSNADPARGTATPPRRLQAPPATASSPDGAEAAEAAAYVSAMRRVRARVGVYLHALVFAVVNALLAWNNLQTSPDHLWFPWPLGLWGLALVLHAASVFLLGEGSRLEARMIRREMRRRAARR